MPSNYPPGVTGNEPQICGSGLEDKCERCVEKADEEAALSTIPDAVIHCDGIGGLCEDCSYDLLKEAGFDPVELVEYIKGRITNDQSS